MSNTSLFYTAKLSPSGGGGEVELQNIRSITWAAFRPPQVNHELGQTNHQLEMVTIERQKSLQTKGENHDETDVIKLAAATGKKAYFSGRITVAPASDPGTIVQTLRWDQGHICSIRNFTEERGFFETIQIATTNLKVDDSEFKLAATV